MFGSHKDRGIAEKLTIFLFALCIAGPSTAEKWYVEPAASLRLGYDDNVRFVATGNEGAFSSLLNANANFGVRTEVSEVKFQAQLNAKRYDGLSDLDTDDPRLRLKAGYRSNLNVFGLDAAYQRESTRTTELTGSGLVQINGRRILQSITPSWKRQVNERTSVQAGYHYTDISFEGAVGLVDYWSDVASLGLEYSLTERMSISGLLSHSRFEAELVSRSYVSDMLKLNFVYKATQTLTLNAGIGFTHTGTDFLDSGVPTSSSDIRGLFDVGVKKEFESIVIEAKTNVTEASGSEGRILRTNAVEISMRQGLSERMVFSFKGRAFKKESAGSVVDTGDRRDFFSLEPKISWKATPWWTIDGMYRYRQQQREGSGTAQSNAVFIMARYVWPRENYSRWQTL